MLHYRNAVIRKLAAAAALALPVPAHAQSIVSPGLSPSIATPGLMAPSPVQTGAVRLMGEHATDGIQFRKTRVAASEIGDIRLMLSASQTIKQHDLLGAPPPRLPKASLIAGAAIEWDMGKEDSLGLFGSYTRERSKPLALFPSRRHFGAEALAVGLEWTHDDSFVASIGGYSTGPSGNRTAVERMVDLAGGGLKDAKGAEFQLMALPADDRAGGSYGFRLQQQRVTLDNLFGQPARRTETIGSFFVAYKF